jgi:hypothetical protein
LKEVKKTPIGLIGKEQTKVTIADEIQLETKYHLEPPLLPKQLAECWLDPSEMAHVMSRQDWKLLVAKQTTKVPYETMETLKTWLKPEALSANIVKFEAQSSFQWSKGKPKILRKYNLTDLKINAQLKAIRSISITSTQPLYDQDAHPNRVRNVLRAVKIRHPEVSFEHEGCWTSGSCPIGLQQALRKLAEETHGKV